MTIKISSDTAGGSITNENSIAALKIDGVGNVTSEVTVPSTDNSKKVVNTAWAKLGFAVLLSGTGYIKFPDWMGGVIIQWGNDPGGAGSGSGNKFVTFPLGFPNNVYSVTGTIVSSGSANFMWAATVNNVTLTSVNFNRRYQSGSTTGDAGESFYWLAVGR